MAYSIIGDFHPFCHLRQFFTGVVTAFGAVSVVLIVGLVWSGILTL
jgi:hypothetical protein